MKTTLYMTNSVLFLSDSGLRAMLAILVWMNWEEPKAIVSVEEIARKTRGHFNPSSDFVLVMPNNAEVRDPVQLCRWIDQQGLVQL